MSEKQPKQRVPAFSTWLAKQQERDDPIGDLAKDVQRDPDRPGARAQYPGWVNHLQAKQASGAAMDALQRAWQEYTQVYKPGAFGLPSLFGPDEWAELVDVLEAEGATFSYDVYGEPSEWTYPPEDKPRMEAAAQAWWKAGSVFRGYSAESRQLINDRDNAERDAARKAAQASRLAEQRRLQRSQR